MVRLDEDARCCATDGRRGPGLPPARSGLLAGPTGRPGVLLAALAEFQPEAFWLNSQLAPRGYIDGMVLAPRLAGARFPRWSFSIEPGWIYLAPRVVGVRTDNWPYLIKLAEAREQAKDPRCVLDSPGDEEGRLILDWLADVEAELKARSIRQLSEADSQRYLAVVSNAP